MLTTFCSSNQSLVNLLLSLAPPYCLPGADERDLVKCDAGPDVNAQVSVDHYEVPGREFALRNAKTSLIICTIIIYAHFIYTILLYFMNSRYKKFLRWDRLSPALRRCRRRQRGGRDCSLPPARRPGRSPLQFFKTFRIFR